MPRYSIIIPAHNEERYIGKTLQKVVKLDYPSYEVIVVENGSTDRTLEVANRFRSKNVRVYSLKKNGISYAKNAGAAKASKTSEWLIFLDADTWLEKEFLRELDAFLQTREKGKKMAIGTTSVRPIERSASMVFWFRTYDLVHKVFKASCAIQIARRKYFNKVKYDEHLKLEEDFQLIKDLRRHGKFFYMRTDAVSSSTRRFKRVGPIRLTAQWLAAAVVPHSHRKKMEYENIR